jgi:endonuclease G
VEEADAQPATDGAGPSILVHDNDVGDLRARVVTTWQKRLQKAGQPLRKAIAAVGRIEVKGNGDLTVAGTGFLVGEDVIATNQHVAAQFAEPDGGGGFVPRLNLGGEEMEASIDFLEELGNSKSLTFPIVEVLRMDADDDVAFLRVGRQSAEGGPLPQPIEFSTDAVQPGQLVAAIGYPQRDTRKEHAAELEAIFHDIFDKKRVSPGEIRGTDAKGRVVHDCSVLRGSSGSPVTDLATGKVVGIHFVGEFLKINLAVPAPKAQQVLDTIDPPLPVAA